MMVEIEVIAENRKNPEKNYIHNKDSLDIFYSLQKLSKCQALHYIHHKDSPLIAYEIYDGFTIVLKANKDTATLYIDDIQNFGEISKLDIFHGKVENILDVKGAHSALKAIKGIQDRKTIIRISCVTFDEYNQLMQYIYISEFSSASEKFNTNKVLSPENLHDRLDMQTKVGAKGEELLFNKLKLKLLSSGINKKDIDQYLIHVSKTDVSKGYDIFFKYEGRTKYIEVKTTINSIDCNFFFSENEYNVLKNKGNEGYIYRLVLNKKLDEIMELKEIKNPFENKVLSEFQGIYFKANLSEFL